MKGYEEEQEQLWEEYWKWQQLEYWEFRRWRTRLHKREELQCHILRCKEVTRKQRDNREDIFEIMVPQEEKLWIPGVLQQDGVHLSVKEGGRFVC